MIKRGRKTELKQNETEKDTLKANRLLILLGMGLVLGITIVTPFAGVVLMKGFKLLFLDEKEWGKYNKYRLKQTVKRMVDRKLLELKTVNGVTTIMVSESGKKQLMKYRFQEMLLQRPEKWDGKWRIVMFDIPEKKKSNREAFRNKMGQLGFLLVQKSVYVTPYPCQDEIAFLRQYFNVGDNVSIFTVGSLEEDEFLRKAFKLS